MSATSLVLRGGTLSLGGTTRRGDVVVHDGRITEVAAHVEAPSRAKVLDCEGCVIGPGLVDLHAHLREPGNEEAETIHTASRAAALGGFTAVVAMPNTHPACDSASIVADVYARARGAACDVAVSGALTVGRAGERLAPMAEMAALGVTLFTDDGHGVQDGDLMRRAMEYARGLGITCAQHCEDATLAAGGVMHEGEWSSRLGLPGQPALAEVAMVQRDLGLAALTGASVHFLHLSVAASVQLVAAARSRGLPVSCEVTPHHLSLDDASCATYDPIFKVCPPLRPRDEVDALVAAVRAGMVDAVATDHAPHAEEAKDLPFDEAPPGMLGLQHAAGLTIEALGGVDGLDVDMVFALLSRRPAAIARLREGDARAGGHGAHGSALAVGAWANLCVIDLQTPHVVTAASLASRAANSPYVGRTLPVTVRHTIFNGEPTVLDAGLVR